MERGCSRETERGGREKRDIRRDGDERERGDGDGERVQ